MILSFTFYTFKVLLLKEIWNIKTKFKEKNILEDVWVEIDKNVFFNFYLFKVLFIKRHFE